MKAEILMIGTELLLGQIEDTNATYMGRVLADNGIDLFQKTTVGDNPDRIKDALRNALSRSDVVICSGGLGPTEDDITRECVAEVMGRPLEYHEDVFERIEAMFARYKIKLTENNKKQAMVPKDAYIVENPHGTAPGLLVDDPKGIIACMPGVPHELHFMLENKIIPFLRRRFGMTGVIHYRVLKVCGVGESRVDEAMGDLMATLQNPKIGVLASGASVRIRISAKAGSIAEADRMIDEVDAQVRDRLPGLIMGVNDETLEGVVDRLLAGRGWRMSVIETATGGTISQLLVRCSASQFVGGEVLSAVPDLQANAHAALEMAQRKVIDSGLDCTLAVLSDPGAGVTQIAFACPEGPREWTMGRAGVNEVMQLRTGVMALEFVRRFLTGVEVPLL